jgi:lysophospholipase L1-like esterase
LIVLDNLAFHRAARAHGATVLPLSSISVSKLAADPANFSNDGLHPSALGYKRFAAMIWPSFERAIAQ